MAKINVLEKQVAELIAAGEVVERPASIVKELVENAVDAGAGTITVEIQGGGVRYIRVTDNGGGIERDDVANAFLRHATSKVRVQEDLNTILTMGFRGEALASIAAMCRVEVLTRVAGDVAGTHYAIAGGEQETLEDAGCPVGTTISVRDVFFNTPARMKFLKKDVSEGNSVAAVVEKTALANPQIAFKFIRDGQMKLQTPGDGQLLSAIRCILGREFAESSIPVHYSVEGVSADGYICKPSIARGSRSLQNFFINTRFIRSKTCMAAIEEAYRNTLMVGRFPSCVLNLTVPPQAVDVNVHPAKIEVRFADEKSIFNAVYYGCKTALGKSRLQPEIKADDARPNPFSPYLPKTAPQQQRLGGAAFKVAPTTQPHLSVGEYKAVLAQALEKERFAGAPAAPYAPRTFQTAPPPRPMAVPPPDDRDAPAFIEMQSDDMSDYYGQRRTETFEELPPLSTPAPEPEPPVADPYENARLVGELFETYLILQSGSDLILVDKHAAHERLLFNRLLAGGIGTERQLLLTPVSVSLSPDEYTVILGNLPLLSDAGLSVEDFGAGFVLVREVSPILAEADLSQIVTEFAGKLLSANSHLLAEQLENLYHTIACRAAIKAHDKTAAPSLELLISLLREDGNADHCPHGRPVAVRMSRYEIEKKFGRLG